MNTRLVNRWILAGLLAVAASVLQAGEEEDLIATLRSAAGAPQKCAACQRLRVVGTAKSVAALAVLLREEPTAHAARYALEGMPFPEAGAALREALETTSGLIQLGLVDSVGWRRDAATVPVLVRLLSGGDAAVAGASAAALGKIGGQEAMAALKTAEASANPAVRAAAWEGLLQCAEQRLASGDAKQAAALARDLNAAKNPVPIRMAAWRCLVLADAKSRTKLIPQALSGEDPSLQSIALKVLRELNDAEVVKACVREWASLPEASQLAVLDAHMPFGAEALPTVRAGSKSRYPSVRVAAWQALGDLGDARLIPALAKAAATAEGGERAAARDTLARLRGNGVREALLEHARKASASEKAELLRALGERGDAEAAGVLVQSVSSAEPVVRLAALESLRKLAVAETLGPLLDLAAGSKSDAERDPVLRALFAICQASRNEEETTRQVVEALGRFAATQRRQVLPLLAELATPAALEAALAATREADVELVKESVRVLARWPSAAPASRLIELARASGDGTLQTLALRGAIEVAGQEPDPAKRLAMLEQAMAAAKRSEEKKQALGQVGQIASKEALEVALASLSDATLSTEAGLAAVNIAEKLAAATPALASEVAVKVLAQCKAPEIVKRAWALRGKPAAGGAFIQDWLVCGPFSQAGANDALSVFNAVLGPEKPGAAIEWKPVPRGDMIELLALFPNGVNCAAYLKTEIVVPTDCEGALLLGSDDGVKAWLNGAVVHSHNIDRGAVADQDIAPIQLKQGGNQLMLKITQGGGGWAACARIVGTDGQPIAGLKAIASP